MLLPALLATLLQAGIQSTPLPPESVDPSLRAVVEQFYAMQEAEDVAGYLALWSRSAPGPPALRAVQLKYIFDSGDDKFSELQFLRASSAGSQARVRVSILRARTDARMKRPDGTPFVMNSRMISSLTLVREGEEWKIVSEGSPADELGMALMKANTPEERKALIEADTDLIGERMFDAMARHADGFARMMQFPEAQQAYERIRDVAREVGNRPAEGRALQNIANALYYLRKFDLALENYEARLAIARDLSDNEGIAVALSGIGTVRYSLFDYTAALPAYREALALHELLDDRMGIATTLISIGNVLYLQGEFDEAIAAYRRSRDLYRSMMFKNGESRAIEGLGLVYMGQGNLAAALEAYGTVVEDSHARKDVRAQGNALQSIGQIHLRLGNTDQARTSFDQSRIVFEAAKDLANAGISWQGLGLTELTATRFADAEKAYVQSEAACRKAGEAECAARAIVGLAFAQAAQEHFDEAIATYGRAIGEFTKLNKIEELARAEVGLSQACFGKKDYDAAVKAAVRARERGTAIAKGDVIWRALVADARATRMLGDADKAMTLTTEAIAAIERLNDASSDRPGRAVAADTESAFALLAVLQASAKDAQAAFVTAERRRAHALRTALYTNEREIFRGMTPDEREEERTIVGELIALHARRDNEQGLPKPDAAKIKKLDAQIQDAAARRRAQQQRLFDRLPDLKRWRGIVGLPERLSPVAGTTIVQFVADDEELLVVTGAVLDASGEPAWSAHLIPIKRGKLAERVAKAMDVSAVKDRELWKKSSAEVFDLLPRELVAQMAAAKRLVIVPDDVLWRIPFEALPVDEGYLADRATVTYAGSMFSMPAVETRAPAPAEGPALLAIAAPDVAPSTADRLKATLPGWTVRPPETAQRETQQIAGAYSEPAPVTQSGAGATERAFRDRAAETSLLHFAAPFRINGGSPLFSFVLLTASPATDTAVDSADDGWLEAREVMNLTLQARLATFTDGAAASMRNAAAASPIVQWAWLAAGVPAIVLPRWPSDDGASQALVGAMYERLRKGDAPADALSLAAAAVRKMPGMEAPFYWAGWMTLGR